MSTDKLNIGQELVKRLQNFNDNIDSIMNKKEPQELLPPPDTLVDALHDPVGPTSGQRLRSKKIGGLHKEEKQIQKMLDAITSDTLELPEITDKNKSNVKPQRLPKRNETNT